MTDEEFKEAEKLSLEMLDWLYSKASGNTPMLLALIKTTALFINYSKRPDVTTARHHAAFMAALKVELKTAAAYAAKHPMPARKGAHA